MSGTRANPLLPPGAPLGGPQPAPGRIAGGNPLLPAAPPPPGPAAPMQGAPPAPGQGAPPGLPPALGMQTAPGARPSDYQQQQAEDTAGGSRFDHRRITSDHAVAGTRGMDHNTLLDKRDQVGGVIDIFTRLARKRDLTRKDISAEIAMKMHSGDVTPDEAITTLNSLPTDDKDPKALREWVLAHLRSSIALAVHLHSAYPTEVFPPGGAPAGTPSGPLPPVGPPVAPAPGGAP